MLFVLGTSWKFFCYILILLLFPLTPQNKLGDTALHAAAWKGYADIVEMLLAKGKDLHQGFNNLCGRLDS